jgi:uncharacterized protein (TIGR02118 family)
MLKMIVTGRRKPGLSLAEFDDHWSNHHSLLVQKLAKTLGIQKYVQNVRAEVPALAVSTPERPESDAVPDFVAELWFTSADDMIATAGSSAGQAANSELDKDSETFCDMSSIVVVFTHERANAL